MLFVKFALYIIIIRYYIKSQVSDSIEGFLERLQSGFDAKIVSAIKPVQDSIDAQRRTVDVLQDKLFSANDQRTSDIRRMEQRMTLQFREFNSRLAAMESRCGVSPPPPVDNSSPIDLSEETISSSEKIAGMKRSSSTDIDSDTRKRFAAMERGQQELGATMNELIKAISSGRCGPSYSQPVQSLPQSLFHSPAMLSRSATSSPDYGYGNDLVQRVESFISEEEQFDRRDRRRQFAAQLRGNYASPSHHYGGLSQGW